MMPRGSCMGYHPKATAGELALGGKVKGLI